MLKRRVERLACDFPVSENYFAWQAFGRAYGPPRRRACRPICNASISTLCATGPTACARITARSPSGSPPSPDKSFDAYVLLDAQDWMNDATLTALWREIRRTARPGARIIFRTAADERLLPGRVPDDILEGFRYEAARAESLASRDRSSIYGAFHLWIAK